MTKRVSDQKRTGGKSESNRRQSLVAVARGLPLQRVQDAIAAGSLVGIAYMGILASGAHVSEGDVTRIDSDCHGTGANVTQLTESPTNQQRLDARYQRDDAFRAADLAWNDPNQMIDGTRLQGLRADACERLTKAQQQAGVLQAWVADHPDDRGARSMLDDVKDTAAASAALANAPPDGSSPRPGPTPTQLEEPPLPLLGSDDPHLLQLGLGVAKVSIQTMKEQLPAASSYVAQRNLVTGVLDEERGTDAWKIANEDLPPSVDQQRSLIDDVQRKHDKKAQVLLKLKHPGRADLLRETRDLAAAEPWLRFALSTAESHASPIFYPIVQDETTLRVVDAYTFDRAVADANHALREAGLQPVARVPVTQNQKTGVMEAKSSDVGALKRQLRARLFEVTSRHAQGEATLWRQETLLDRQTTIIANGRVELGNGFKVTHANPQSMSEGWQDVVRHEHARAQLREVTSLANALRTTYDLGAPFSTGLLSRTGEVLPAAEKVGAGQAEQLQRAIARANEALRGTPHRLGNPFAEEPGVSHLTAAVIVKAEASRLDGRLREESERAVSGLSVEQRLKTAGFPTESALKDPTGAQRNPNGSGPGQGKAMNSPPTFAAPP